MHITRALAGARDAHTVYCLLTAYVEALGHAENHGVPSPVTLLPVGGMQDVAARLRALAAAGSCPGAVLTERGAATAAEAHAVFRAALSRLKFFEGGGADDAPGRARAAA